MQFTINYDGRQESLSLAVYSPDLVSFSIDTRTRALLAWMIIRPFFSIFPISGIDLYCFVKLIASKFNQFKCVTELNRCYWMRNMQSAK